MIGGTTQATSQATGCRTRFTGLLAPGLPVDQLDRLARELGLAPVTDPVGTEPLAALVTAGERDGTCALDADMPWLPPVAAWIEPRSRTDASELARLLADAAGNDLYLNLTTATAHDLQLGGRLLAALSARLPPEWALDGGRRADVELALHEAVSNALVHGNLGVAAMRELSARELERFSRDLGDRLADPVLAARRIVIALRLDPAENGRPLATVEITDEGTGFKPGPRSSSEASGRGLGLIGEIADRLEIEDGGRRIRLEFRL
ncbi:ATP-binding protein [Azospirillum endophyticum]